MRKLISYGVVALFATSVISFASHKADKGDIKAKETAAWQAFKDKDAAAFQKLVDKDIRSVYADGVHNMEKELEAMKKWDMKSFEISDYDSFSDEKDIIVTTYTVKIEGTFDGKDVSGTYNDGSVWKKENGTWMGIFHTNIKQQSGG